MRASPLTCIRQYVEYSTVEWAKLLALLPGYEKSPVIRFVPYFKGDSPHFELKFFPIG